MNLNNFTVLTLLILLTLLSAISVMQDPIPTLLLFFAALKFCLIAFYFMEMKEAHRNWKFIIAVYIAVFVIIFKMI